MSITKNKILLRDASSLKDFEERKGLMMHHQRKNGYCYYYRYYWYEWEDDIDVDCPVCRKTYCSCVYDTYAYQSIENTFGDKMVTCIPSGKEYLRNMKIDELLIEEDKKPLTDIQAQLLKLGLLSQ